MDDDTCRRRVQSYRDYFGMTDDEGRSALSEMPPSDEDHILLYEWMALIDPSP